jgi:7-cyano-7-deazaguanine synthase in queuosine biosynthesis
VLDLALDMDVPLAASWWCDREQDGACGSCGSCARWRAAQEQVDPQGLVQMMGSR